MAALSSRLLEVPAEIRTRIYEILFADVALAVKESPPKTVILQKSWHNCLLTCRTIRREALPLFCSSMTLLVCYESGFVVPDWAAFREPGTACPEPADWSRTHIRDWTAFPSLISNTYLSGVERAAIHSDQSCFSSFMLHLHNLPKLNYLEIRSLTLQFDGPAGGSPDVDLLGSDADMALVELVRTGLFGSNGYLDQLRNFSSKYSRYFKARVIFPVKENELYTVNARIDIDDVGLFCKEYYRNPQAFRWAVTLDRLLSERPMERGQSDGDTDRKEINETEEESPESLFSCCAQQIALATVTSPKGHQEVIGKRIVFLRGGGESKPFDTINKFNVFGSFGWLKGLKSVFTDTYPYCLLSKRCFEEITSKRRGRSTPLPEGLPDELKHFVPVCGITLSYETPNLPGPSWEELFIVVERLPLPEDVSVDCNISIVFTSQIREKLEAVIETRRQHWQQLLGEATEMEGEKGGETRPNENQGDVEDHGDWVIVEGSPNATSLEISVPN